MAGKFGKSWLVWPVALLLAALLVYAWIDGGREPLRTISTPIALPESHE